MYVFRKVYRAEDFCRLGWVKVLLDRFWADCDNWTWKRSEQRLCCCAEYLPIQPIVPVGAQKENVWLQLIHRLSKALSDWPSLQLPSHGDSPLAGLVDRKLKALVQVQSDVRCAFEVLSTSNRAIVLDLHMNKDDLRILI